MCNNNSFIGSGAFCIFFGIMYFFVLHNNIPASYKSNPLESNDTSEKYYYFNNASASEDCNKIKEDILVKDKTLSGMFPNPNTIIAIAKAIEWITLIISIYLFFMLFVREIEKSCHNILCYIEIIVGFLLSLFWIIIILIEKPGLDKYNDFLSCKNVNRDKIKTIPDFDILQKIYFYIILYIFYIPLYFSTIFARNYVFKNDYDYNLI